MTGHHAEEARLELDHDARASFRICRGQPVSAVGFALRANAAGSTASLGFQRCVKRRTFDFALDRHSFHAGAKSAQSRRRFSIVIRGEFAFAASVCEM